MTVEQKSALIVAIVGMPARGKTYTARKIARYLNWRGHDAKVFNVGNYRRKHLGAKQPATFFDPENPEGRRARKQMAMAALEDMIGWLSDGGEVAIYDATNSTRVRRGLIQKTADEHQTKLIFVESICDMPSIIEENIRETKISSPDYRGIDEQHAVTDFRKRIAFYHQAYEPLQPDEGSWVKIIDVGRQIITNEITGYLPGRIVFFLMNIHLGKRLVWLTRHGESQYNVAGKIGGDSMLSARGEKFSTALSAHFSSPKRTPSEVWTSTLHRTIQTSKHLAIPTRHIKNLDELNAGVRDGLTYEQIKSRFPEEYAARKQNKFGYRYPQGESYQDLIRRLDPIIVELERKAKPVLIVAHQAVLRALYAYLMDIPPEQCPFLDMPLHTVIQLEPKAYGCAESRTSLDSSSDSATTSSILGSNGGIS